ncbi:MAG: glycosyltransferase [Candidatus Micrarchaeia archaeon]
MNGQKLSILIIMPYLDRFEGSKLGLAICSSLSSMGHDVELLINECQENIIVNIEKAIGKTNLEILRRKPQLAYGKIYALKYYITSLADRSIVNHIVREEKHYDIVLVIANEGLNIAKLIEKKYHGKLFVAMLIQDPPLNNVLNYREPRGIFEFLKGALKGAFFSMNRKKIRRKLQIFQALFANSFWTKQIVEYVFGVNIKSILNAYLPQDLTVKDEINNPYIAVPTVALNETGVKTIEELRKRGINLRIFGKMDIKGSMGYISTPEMVNLISQASATLFLFDYEGLGLIPIESLSLGTPVITEPKLAPFSELVDNPNVMFFNDVDDLEALCRKVLTTPKTQELRDRCKLSVSRFVPVRAADELIRVYLNSIKEKVI